MEDMRGRRFKNQNTQGADHTFCRSLALLPLAKKPGVGGGQNFLSCVFYRPGIRSAKVIAKEADNTALAGLFAVIAATHSVCNGNSQAFVC